MFKLTREGQQNKEKNKKVLDKRKTLWYNIKAVA